MTLLGHQRLKNTYTTNKGAHYMKKNKSLFLLMTLLLVILASLMGFFIGPTILYMLALILILSLLQFIIPVKTNFFQKFIYIRYSILIFLSSILGIIVADAPGGSLLGVRQIFMYLFLLLILFIFILESRYYDPFKNIKIATFFPIVHFINLIIVGFTILMSFNSNDFLILVLVILGWIYTISYLITIFMFFKKKKIQ